MADRLRQLGAPAIAVLALAVLAFIVVIVVPYTLASRGEAIIGRQAALRATSIAASIGADVERQDVESLAEALADVRAARGTEYAYLLVRDAQGGTIASVHGEAASGIPVGARRVDGVLHVAVPIPRSTAVLQVGIEDESYAYARSDLLLAGFLALSLLAGAAALAVSRAGAPRAQPVPERPATAARSTARADPTMSLTTAGTSSSLTGDVYLAWMSHELRTPLNAIIGYSEMLEEDAAFLEQDDFIPDLQNIRKAGRHLLSLVDDVVDLSRLHAGTMDIRPAEVDLVDFTEALARDVQPLVTRTLGTLEVRVAPHAGSAVVDSAKLARALSNLLRQVMGLTGQGEMTLEVDRVGIEENAMLQFSLTHPGLGLDEEQARTLLSDHAQPEQRALPQYARTGLGLVVTREFVQLMGGELVLHDAAPGTRFVVRVPADMSGMSTD